MDLQPSAVTGSTACSRPPPTPVRLQEWMSSFFPCVPHSHSVSLSLFIPVPHGQFKCLAWWARRGICCVSVCSMCVCSVCVFVFVSVFTSISLSLSLSLSLSPSLSLSLSLYLSVSVSLSVYFSDSDSKGFIGMGKCTFALPKHKK